MNEKIYHHTKTFIYSRQAGLGATRRTRRDIGFFAGLRYR